jgi:hypothetical protein
MLEVGKNRSVRLPKQEIVQEKRLRDERDHLAVKRRKPDRNFAFGCQRIADLLGVRPLCHPTAGNQQPESDAKIAAIAACPLHDLVKAQPRRRISEQSKHAAISQRFDHRRQDNPG